jgi:hypothetical protein
LLKKTLNGFGNRTFQILITKTSWEKPRITNAISVIKKYGLTDDITDDAQFNEGC